MKISGIHQKKAVEVEVRAEVINALRDRAERVAQKFEQKGMGVATEKRQLANQWQKVAETSELLNSPEYQPLVQEYIDHALFNEKRFDGMFR